MNLYRAFWLRLQILDLVDCRVRPVLSVVDGWLVRLATCCSSMANRTARALNVASLTRIVF